MEDLFASLCKCNSSRICFFCAQLTVTTIATVFGALLMWRPKKVIEIQIALYKPFNWKIEPVSMTKEIRNTRLMGLAVFIAGIVSFVLVLI
ncbi:MAG: hypothetical protein ABID09_05415 [Candidatus Omnitrophota bacterium]